MKLLVLLLVPLAIPACSNRSTEQAQAVVDEAPQTTVYISSRVADPVVDKPVIVQEAQPDPTPAPAAQPKGHRRAVKHAASRSRMHANFQSSHVSFHSSTPD